jgi:hypothetical protein
MGYNPARLIRLVSRRFAQQLALTGCTPSPVAEPSRFAFSRFRLCIVLLVPRRNQAAAGTAGLVRQPGT